MLIPNCNGAQKCLQRFFFRQNILQLSRKRFPFLNDECERGCVAYRAALNGLHSYGLVNQIKLHELMRFAPSAGFQHCFSSPNGTFNVADDIEVSDECKHDRPR